MYDPFRNARLALVKYEDGEYRYHLHALGYYVGQQLLADEMAPPYVGNALPLVKVPIGTNVHCIEQHAGETRGGTIARAAGTCATVLAKDEEFVTLKMPS